jgi:uncharacterized protein
MSEQENLRVVQQLFECFGRGDVPGLLELLDEDVDWHIKGPEVVPFYGPHRGRDGVVAFLGKLSEAAEFESFEPRDFFTAGGRVVVLGAERARAKPTGKTFDNEWAMVFTLRDGRITAFRSHEDTAAVAAAFA